MAADQGAGALFKYVLLQDMKTYIHTHSLSFPNTSLHFYLKKRSFIEHILVMCGNLQYDFFCIPHFHKSHYIVAKNKVEILQDGC